MKKKLLALFAAALLLLFPVLCPAEGEQPAFSLTFYDPEGSPVQTSDFAGTPLVLNFWATWCGYCVKEMPDFEELYREYGDRVQFMMVDLTDDYGENPEAVQQFLAEYGYTFPVYLDTDGASYAYTYMGIPVTLTVDRNGNPVRYHIGMTDGETLRGYIEELLADTPE